MGHAYACEWIEREWENISSDPPMPENLDSRVLDNWRPLIAIADASGMGEEARAAMLALSADSEPGINVMALADIRIVFDRAGDDLIVDTQWGDVIPTEKLLKQLHTLDEADGRWRYYCGPKGKSAPRKLTDRALADLLKDSGLSPIDIGRVAAARNFAAMRSRASRRRGRLIARVMSSDGTAASGCLARR